MVGFMFLFLAFVVCALWFCEDTKLGRKFSNWILRKLDNSGWHYED